MSCGKDHVGLGGVARNRDHACGRCGEPSPGHAAIVGAAHRDGRLRHPSGVDAFVGEDGHEVRRLDVDQLHVLSAQAIFLHDQIDVELRLVGRNADVHAFQVFRRLELAAVQQVLADQESGGRIARLVVHERRQQLHLDAAVERIEQRRIGVSRGERHLVSGQ